jgi:hypothetical protein
MKMLSLLLHPGTKYGHSANTQEPSHLAPMSRSRQEDRTIAVIMIVLAVICAVLFIQSGNDAFWSWIEK